VGGPQGSWLSCVGVGEGARGVHENLQDIRGWFAKQGESAADGMFGRRTKRKASFHGTPLAGGVLSAYGPFNSPPFRGSLLPLKLLPRFLPHQGRGGAEPKNVMARFFGIN